LLVATVSPAASGVRACVRACVRVRECMQGSRVCAHTAAASPLRTILTTGSGFGGAGAGGGSEPLACAVPAQMWALS
jgi:hypothetical protein